MPRRGRSASPPPAPRRAASPPPVQRSPVPVAPPQTAMAPAAPQQPSMFQQMAATAGGVAVGSAIGHTVGHAMTGMFSGGSDKEVAPQQQVPQQQPMANGYSSQSNNGPCSFEIDQFIQCAQGQADLTICEGFNEALRQCKTRYNIAQ
ncbi:coiled-coil-helix-coiled-coil-helix domain-containing protein 2 [Sergentomyia squamirostris]